MIHGHLSLIGAEQGICHQPTKVYVFLQILYCILIKSMRNSNQTLHGKTRDFVKIDGEPMEFEWNILTGSNTLQLSQETKSLLLKFTETPENFAGRIIFMWMCNNFSFGLMKKNASRMLNSFPYLPRDLVKDNGHFLVLVQRKWYSFSAGSPQDEWDNCREDDVRIWRKQTSNLPCYESIVQEGAKNAKLFAIERGNPVCVGNRVLHLCQARSRQKCFWIVMTSLEKIFHCKNMVNEL